MTVVYLVVKDLTQLLRGHSLTGVFDRDLHTIINNSAANGHGASLRGKLPCIISYRIDHEQSQYPVGLHHILGGDNLKGDILHLERHLRAGHDIQ